MTLMMTTTLLLSFFSKILFYLIFRLTLAAVHQQFDAKTRKIFHNSSELLKLDISH